MEGKKKGEGGGKKKLLEAPRNSCLKMAQIFNELFRGVGTV